MLQTLYALRSTYIETHERSMLAQQRQEGVLERILKALRLSEKEKEARHLWEQAEIQHARAHTDDDYRKAINLLAESRSLDPINPAVYLSVDAIHSTLGHPALAAAAYAEADFLLDNIERDERLASFNLLNLAASLQSMGRFEHAERVMRKATKIDARNREVWFQFARAAWQAGKHNSAVSCLVSLLRKDENNYRLRISSDPVFKDLLTAIHK